MRSIASLNMKGAGHYIRPLQKRKTIEVWLQFYVGIILPTNHVKAYVMQDALR